MVLARLSETDPAEYAFVESINVCYHRATLNCALNLIASFTYYLQVSVLSDIV
jgi:hypothetical protein